jgi:hypothetical protein
MTNRRTSAVVARSALIVVLVLLPRIAAAQNITGALIGTVKDADGGVLPGATVRLSSPSLIGGALTQQTNDQGQMRFITLPPGLYVIDIEMPGFDPLREESLRIGAGATIERTVVLRVAGVTQSVVVEGAGSNVEARDPGFATRFGQDDLMAIPTRRSSMFDFVRSAPGISPTSPSSGTTTTISAFGSGVNENMFLIDGTNFTCPCNGVARAEPGIDFIQEIQIQSVGASAEFGSVEGAVINVITRQGGERFQYDASYYGQPSALTSQPVVQPIRPGTGESGYEREHYRDFTTSLGGPLLPDHLWFFAGYQYLRDSDSQPGTDPALPRRYEQNKVFAKLTWRLAPSLQLLQSVHAERWVSPERPTAVTPFEATVRPQATMPAITFGHLTHTASPTTVWDVRVGRFAFDQDVPPSTGDRTTASRFDRATNVTSFAPPQFGWLWIARTTIKGTVSHYRPAVLGADHQLKMGGQVERGEHQSPIVISTGTRYIDDAGRPFRSTSSDPSNTGGMSRTTSAFVSDALTIADRLTLNAGLRFDHSRAISQELPAVDLLADETGETIAGSGTLYAWNLWSPRLGLTARLTADGRTMLRASYGRFSQGVLTGEFGLMHPASSPVTTFAYEEATGGYTRFVSRVDNTVNASIDERIRAPYTDEFSAGVDRDAGHGLSLAIAYVRKNGNDFIGWTDVGGRYAEQPWRLPDGSTIPVFVLTNLPAARHFLLTNPEDYSLTYNGLVLAAEKRQSRSWQASGSYTFSRVSGLQASSGATAAAGQASTVAPPPAPALTFGRDPNDLTNARGRMPNDRPHVFRVMGSVEMPRTGLVVAANLQHFSGKPWAASTQVVLPYADQRVLLEPRGSRRLSSQTLLDLRLSKTVSLGRDARIDLILDVLNALNDTAEEALATDDLYSVNFGRPTVFIDPRRVMLGARLNLGH